MHIISKKKLVEFWSQAGRQDSRMQLDGWYRNVSHAVWRNLADIRRDYSTVDYVGNDRYVFNICGNKYRLVVIVDIKYSKVFVRWVGTHAEYDRIDCRTI